MRKSVLAMFVLLITSFLMVSMLAAEEKGKMETATGKVTSVDPGGKAITISVKTGGSHMMDVGTIVNADTKVRVKGKPASLNDIKEGDTVTIRYLKSDDLYAKEITSSASARGAGQMK